VGLALDPSASGRPTVVYERTSGSYARLAVALRTGANTWTQTPLTYAVHTTSTWSQYLRGDVTFDAAGTLYLPAIFTGSGGTNPSGSYLASWTPTTVAFASLSSFPALTSSTSVAWRGPGQLLMMSGGGLLDVQVGSPLSTSVVQNSYVETSSTSQHAVAADASGAPWLAVNHGSTLEVVHTGARNFWERENLGATDSAVIDATMDGADAFRVCFFRAGKLLLY